MASEHHIPSGGVWGWVVYAVSLSVAFVDPATAWLKLIAAATAAFIGVVKVVEWYQEKQYNRRKRGGI